MFASVLLTRNTKAIDMAFTYKVPEEFQGLISVGDKVIVPFGRGNQLQEAFVFEIDLEKPKVRLKTMVQLIDRGGLTEKQLEGVKWLKNTYLCTYSEAIQVFSAPGSQLNKEVMYRLVKPFEIESQAKKNLMNLLNEGLVPEEIVKGYQLNGLVKGLVESKHIKKTVTFKQKINPIYQTMVSTLFEENQLHEILKEVSSNANKQKQVLKFMASVGVCRLSDLTRDIGANKATLKPLIKKGFLTCDKQLVKRRPEVLKGQSNLEKNPLSFEQEKVFFEISKQFNNFSKFLIQGVTGSGKTEVYMALVEQVLLQNKQVIILVPEIALTPQMVGKFFKRFGHNIGIVHSKLSAGERYDQYQAIALGEINIVIGARSAVFSPCQNLGLIIMDEAHESSYKSDASPKYNTIEVAEFLCRASKIPLVLASATPNVETFYQTTKDYKLLSLHQRYNEKPLPFVHLVDMKDELIQGNKSMFSELLLEKIQERLDKKEQIILFFNKKGFASFVSCRSCGYVMKCPRCDVSLTYHHKNQESKCSYCGYKEKIKEVCPSCQSHYFKYFGSGTEKVESLLNERFKTARIQRLDSESTSKKGSLEEIIRAMENREIDILLGTQMVAKGLDFEYVTLVGALSADISLNLPDYLASEKTFQLLTQVAGRAGRAALEGEVVIQTYEPEHYAIQSAVSQDYLSFYQQEIEIRQAYNYPPFVELISILVVGPDEKRTIDSSFNLHRELERFLHKRIPKENIEILGPNPCIIQKINHKYRWQIILKFDKRDLEMVRNIIQYVCITNKKKVVSSDVYIGININPLSLL